MFKPKKSLVLPILFLLLFATFNIFSQTPNSNNSVAGMNALDEGRMDLLKYDLDEAQKNGKEDVALSQTINERRDSGKAKIALARKFLVVIYHTLKNN